MLSSRPYGTICIDRPSIRSSELLGYFRPSAVQRTPVDYSRAFRDDNERGISLHAIEPLPEPVDTCTLQAYNKRKTEGGINV